MKMSEMWKCEITVSGIGVWENYKPTRPEAMELVERWKLNGFIRMSRTGVMTIYLPSQIKRIRIVPPRAAK
jgi:hypothetical protein